LSLIFQGTASGFLKSRGMGLEVKDGQTGTRGHAEVSAFLPPGWLIASGLVGSVTGVMLERNGAAGSRVALALSVDSILSGIVPGRRGKPSHSVPGIIGGIIDIIAGVLMGILLGLCWYTLDPLKLHWEGKLPFELRTIRALDEGETGGSGAL